MLVVGVEARGRGDARGVQRSGGLKWFLDSWRRRSFLVIGGRAGVDRRRGPDAVGALGAEPFHGNLFLNHDEAKNDIEGDAAPAHDKDSLIAALVIDDTTEHRRK